MIPTGMMNYALLYWNIEDPLICFEDEKGRLYNETIEYISIPVSFPSSSTEVISLE